MTTSAELLDRLLLVTRLLAEDTARFEREHDLTGPRVHLLWQLGEEGPVRQGALAPALGVTPRHITGLVDDLVAGGYVRRDPHPSDRRALVVSLTPAGERFVAELQRSHEELAGQLFGEVPSVRRGALAAELDALAARLSELVTS